MSFVVGDLKSAYFAFGGFEVVDFGAESFGVESFAFVH